MGTIPPAYGDRSCEADISYARGCVGASALVRKLLYTETTGLWANLPPPSDQESFAKLNTLIQEGVWNEALIRTLFMSYIIDDILAF